MGTRSTIAILHKNGKVRQIYCHWDGYLEHNGRILWQSYQNPRKIRDLIQLGSLSSLKENPSQCIAYSRDRGEDFSSNSANVFPNVEDFFEHANREEYNYLYTPYRGWLVHAKFEGFNTWGSLEKVLKQKGVL